MPPAPLLYPKPPLPEAAGNLWNPSSSPAEDKEDHAHHQKQKEQELGNSCGCRCDPAEPKDRCYQRDY